MKKKPVYFSIGFLFLFLASFSTNTYVSLNSALKSGFHFSKGNEVKQSTSASASEDLVFEETEDDCKDDFEMLAHTIPFSTSILQLSFIQSLSSAYIPDVIQVTDRIFVAIRNFRI